MNYAAQYGVKMLFTIYGTPPWANGDQGPNVAPKSSGSCRTSPGRGDAVPATTRGGRADPPARSRFWTAWNEPNEPFQLSPQFKRVAVAGSSRPRATTRKICNAVYAGVHSTRISGEKVACGVTAPGGKQRARCKRPSVVRSRSSARRRRPE